jgi:hypothetical protein
MLNSRKHSARRYKRQHYQQRQEALSSNTGHSALLDQTQSDLDI